MAQRREKKTVRSKKRKIHIPSGVVHIKSSYNNTLISLTDLQGNVLAWSSGGHIGYKGARKGTAFSAQQAAETLVRAAHEFQMKKVNIITKGPGPGREPVIRSFQGSEIEVETIKDITPRPHNGTRDKRPKRK